MAKKPNYNQERRERDRLKAARKLEKANAKAEKRESAKEASPDAAAAEKE